MACPDGRRVYRINVIKVRASRRGLLILIRYEYLFIFFVGACFH